MKLRSNLTFLLLACFLFVTVSSSAQKFRDESLSMDERLKDLLEQLTLEEKVSLLTETAPPIERLGIAKYWHGNEALHGIFRPGQFTVFPQAIALAAMWNKELHYEIATAISDEARGRWNELDHGAKQVTRYSDLLTFWSPTVNMARDPRWGRTPETYGEDPFLAGTLGVQFVKGLQGDHPKYLKAVSTPKHFAANNEEHNRFTADPTISQKDLREYYLPAFEYCIKEGKAQSIMAAYNAINGVPCGADPWLLTDLLRGEWGFNGYVVSDCGDLPGHRNAHHYVETLEEAAMVSIKAGLDLECGFNVYRQPLLNAVAQGMVSQSEIDTAAYRVLRGRMLLGLFDNPADNPYNFISPSVVGSPEHQALALKAAEQSLVLLKNKNNFLPLDKNKIRKIAVVGINAANCEFGDYSGTPINTPVSVLDGIKNYVGGSVQVLSAPWVIVSDGYQLIDKAFFPDGLKAEYFSNKNLEGTPKVRTDAQIDYEPAGKAPDPFLPKGEISIRWTGEIQPNVSGEYTFGYSTKDGCRLWFDGEQVVDSWGNRGVVTDSFKKTLVAGKKYKIVAEYFHNSGNAVAQLKWKAPDNGNDVQKASIDAARASDITIAVLGINKTLEREGRDRTTMNLPADQEEFIKKIMKANPRTVVVLVAGSSMSIEWIDANVPAILNAWYPGEQGGTAVANALFGAVSPAGRLPLTYYRSLSDLPAFDNYNISNSNRTYKYFKGNVLYPFGHGLSYASFDYTGLQLADRGATIEVSADIANTGKMDADEVVQVYVKLPMVNGVQAIKELKGFTRVTVGKGETRKVVINVEKEKLRLYDENKMEYVYPKGTYSFMLGASSSDIRLSKDINL